MKKDTLFWHRDNCIFNTTKTKYYDRAIRNPDAEMNKMHIRRCDFWEHRLRNRTFGEILNGELSNTTNYNDVRTKKIFQMALRVGTLGRKNRRR